MGYDIDFITALNFIIVPLCIVLKFTASVNLWLALDQYMNLQENGRHFLYACACSVAPAALVAPMYTYDHEVCLAANWHLTQKEAGLYSCVALVCWAVILGIFILTPSTWIGWSCCKWYMLHRQVKPAMGAL